MNKWIRKSIANILIQVFEGVSCLKLVPLYLFRSLQITHHFLSLWSWQTWCCELVAVDPERTHGPENPRRTQTSPVHRPDTRSPCSEAAWWTVSRRKQPQLLNGNQRCRMLNKFCQLSLYFSNMDACNYTWLQNSTSKNITIMLKTSSHTSRYKKIRILVIYSHSHVTHANKTWFQHQQCNSG